MSSAGTAGGSGPNVFVVGAPKCGTTSLYEYLGQHPEVFVPAKKELHYYTSAILHQHTAGPGDSDTLRAIVDSRESYLQHYAGAQGFKRAADVSPSYLFNHAVSRDIHRDSPDAYIIAILRDPVDRAYSQYLHMRRGQQETLSFEDALDAEPERIAAGWADVWRYVDSSRYGPGLNGYLSVFGRDRVHVVLTEHLAADPQAVMTDVFTFLELAPLTFVSPVQRNVGGVARSPALARALSRPSRAKRIAGRLMTQSMRSRIALGLTEANTSPGDSMPESARARLVPEFVEDCHEVTRVLGRPVPWQSTQWAGT